MPPDPNVAVLPAVPVNVSPFIVALVIVAPSLNTASPVPLSLLRTPASCADVVEPKTDRLFAVYATVPPTPKVIVLPSVPDSVTVLFAVNVLPSATVSVDPVAGAVSVTLLMVVADATPSVGVVRVGDVALT